MNPKNRNANIACFFVTPYTILLNSAGSLQWVRLKFNIYHLKFSLTFALQNISLFTMANHKATKKDVRQSRTRNERNRYYGKTTRNAIRELKAVTDKAVAGEKIPDVISMIDKMAKRNIIHKNKAANLKSKLTKKVNALASASAAAN